MTNHLSYRSMLFSFLGDESVAKSARIVGAVLILRTTAKHKFRSNRPVDLAKTALLAGCTEATARQAFDALVGANWLEETERGYRVPEARYISAIEKQRAYHALKNEEKKAA